jgi:hypothetical protein
MPDTHVALFIYLHKGPVSPSAHILCAYRGIGTEIVKKCSLLGIGSVWVFHEQALNVDPKALGSRLSWSTISQTKKTKNRYTIVYVV